MLITNNDHTCTQRPTANLQSCIDYMTAVAYSVPAVAPAAYLCHPHAHASVWPVVLGYRHDASSVCALC